MIGWLKGHLRNYHPYDPSEFNADLVRFSDPRQRWEEAFQSVD